MHCFGMLLMVLIVAAPVVSGLTHWKKSAASGDTATQPAAEINRTEI